MKEKKSHLHHKDLTHYPIWDYISEIGAQQNTDIHI